MQVGVSAGQIDAVAAAGASNTSQLLSAVAAPWRLFGWALSSDGAATGVRCVVDRELRLGKTYAPPLVPLSGVQVKLMKWPRLLDGLFDAGVIEYPYSPPENEE